MEKAVSDLNSFNLGSLKDEESGRVALYHYLKNFYVGPEPVSPALINRFFADCLQLPHWQEKRNDLYQDILDLLQRFYSQNQGGSVFAFNLLWDLSKFQLLLINQTENLAAIIKNWEQTTLKEAENLRVIPDGDRQIIAIRKQSNGDYCMRTYTHLVRVAGHQLIPIGHDQELYYDINLELKLDVSQKLRTAPHSHVRFILRSSQIDAQFISGFAFRQNQVLNLSSISQDPRIFYALKRLERYYIYRPTDPYYLELIGTLDKAIVLIRTQTPDGQGFARQAFEGGQIAFDQIFPDDKALYVRLRELAKLLTSQPKSSIKDLTV